MEFGLLKSKIDKKLTESYSNETFNKEIKNFKKLVLENTDISKAYHIYNELSKNKGFEKEFADDYLDECVELFNRIKFNQKSISLLESWVGKVKCENEYKDIDTLFGKNTLVIENIINSKNRILSNLTTKVSEPEVVKIPLDQVVEVANNALKNYLESLNESELKDIKKYMSLSESELKTRYEMLSEMVVEKLESLSNESDEDVKKSIKETINKIQTENVDSISLLKLKSLNENL